MENRKRSLGSKKVSSTAIRGLGIFGETENKDSQGSAGLRRTRIGTVANMTRTNLQLTPVENNRRSMAGGNSASNYRSFASSTPRLSTHSLAPWLGTTGNKDGRNSAIGTKKNMNDKSCQRQVEQELVDFCRLYQYPRIDKISSSKCFPLDSTEFRNLFTWLVRHLSKDLPELDSKSLADRVPDVLKKIGYPGPVSKQTFQTLGTKHSWSGVLTVLQYLLRRAKLTAILESNIQDITFPNMDEDGFIDHAVKSTDCIVHECFMDCYSKFTKSEDNYNSCLDTLENRFYQREGVSIDKLEETNKEARQVRNRLHEFDAKHETAKTGLDAQINLLNAKNVDLSRFKEFCLKMEKSSSAKAHDCEKLKSSNVALREKELLIKEELNQLTNVCKNVKNIDPDYMSPQIQNDIEILEKNFSEMESFIRATDTDVWEQEKNVSKKIAEILDVCKNYNEKLVKLGLHPEYKQYENLALIEECSPSKLELHTNVDDLKQFLTKLEKKLLLDLKSDVEKARLLKKESEQAAKELEIKRAEIDKGQQEVGVKNKAKSSIQTRISKDESNYQLEISKLQDVVKDVKSKGQVDLKALEETLHYATQDLDSLKLARDKSLDDSHRLLTTAVPRFREKRETRIALFNQKKKEYEEAHRKKIDEVENKNEEIEKGMKKLPRMQKCRKN